MADSVIGALRVVLGADTAALENGLKKANSQLSSFGAGVAKSAGLVAATFAGMAVGIAVAVKKSLDEADKLGKMAQSIGIPVEELSALKHAADLSGISLESLGKGVTKLSRAMIEAAANPTGEAAKAFQALGVSVTDANGKVKTSSDVLTEVAGKFGGLQDGAAKTTLAVKLFGRAGAELIPLLNSGKDGLAAMTKEAADLGLIITDKTAKSAEAFNDNLTRLGKIANGIILQFTAHLAPGLELVSAQLVQASKDANLVKTGAEALITVFVGVIEQVTIMAVRLERLSVTWAAFKALMTAPTFAGISEAWTNLNNVIEENKKSMADVRTGFETSSRFTETFSHFLDKSAESGDKNKKSLDAQAISAKAATNALQSFMNSTQRSILSQQAELATVGLASGAKEKLRIVTQGLAIAQQNGIAVGETMRLKLEELGNQAADAALKLQGANLVLEATEPSEKFRDEMSRNQQALTAFGATAEQVARVNIKTAEAYGATWAQVLPGAISGFTALATEFGKQNKKIATMAKALGIVEAVINTYVGFTKALSTLPPPFNYVAAAGVLAAGMAKVAAIKSQQIPGAALGGSFTVPGGMSATDNRFVPLNLAAGERVDITPANEADKRAAAQVINLTVPDQMISREYMRKMFDSMNDMFRDGYQLKLATVS